MTDAALCRRNHWKVGTRLRGVESAGDWWCCTTIEITAIGEASILAKAVSQVGSDGREGRSDIGMEAGWTLQHRKWTKVVKGSRAKAE